MMSDVVGMEKTSKRAAEALEAERPAVALCSTLAQSFSDTRYRVKHVGYVVV
jgi:hypothetical protein